MRRRYITLTAPEIYDLDKNTLFTVVVSPVEVHGPHLPVGTDILIARYLQKAFEKRWHYSPIVRLPELPIGADPQPVKGSFPSSSKALQHILLSWAMALHSMGFRYMLVFDNHGGPRHQLALYKASKYMLKRGFYIIVPFLHIMHEMIVYDRKLHAIGSKEYIGSSTDLHAGTNETSLMLEAYPRLVKHPLPQQHIPHIPVVGVLLRKTMGSYGEWLDTLIGWITEKDNPGYVGDPQKASENRGRAMLEYHIRRYISLTKQAYNQTYKPHPPLPLPLRTIISLVPEGRVYKKAITGKGQ